MERIIPLKIVNVQAAGEIDYPKNIHSETAAKGGLTLKIKDVIKMSGNVNAQGSYDEEGGYMSVLVSLVLTKYSGSDIFTFSGESSLTLRFSSPEYVKKQVAPQGIIIENKSYEITAGTRGTIEYTNPPLPCSGNVSTTIKRGTEMTATSKTSKITPEQGYRIPDLSKADTSFLVSNWLVPISGIEIRMASVSSCELDVEFVVPKETKSVDIVLDNLKPVSKSISGER